ncbi:sensor histidine kinase [Shouchella patagoniensis]|uniref:sensor histidine kinase n=1 Tax=Shouchella patagoniensis TaxID=228576 RepID=UPI0009950701|nr:histidine kinase [Shouchella patagoniensis]
MSFWMRFILVIGALSLWPMDEPQLLSDPVYWIVAGLVLAGVCSEPMWVNTYLLYNGLTAFGCLFLLYQPSLFGWIVPMLLLVMPLVIAPIARVHFCLSLLYFVLTSVFTYSNGAEFLIISVVTAIAVTFGLAYSRLVMQVELQEDLLDDFAYEQRVLKQQLLQEEDTAKQEERTRIARNVHDSVGHQLTALMMQLQMAELNDSHDKTYISDAKQTARLALEEMRNAVKALEKEEVRGVAMILRLIRKLETESQVQVAFTTEAGALSTLLTDEQNTTLYRFIQEGLTNAMRHAYAKQIRVHLTVIGTHTYMASVENDALPTTFREGFGLSQLRNRFEHLDGRFSAGFGFKDNTFVLKGTFPLQEGGSYENDLSSRGSTNRATRFKDDD